MGLDIPPILPKITMGRSSCLGHADRHSSLMIGACLKAHWYDRTLLRRVTSKIIQNRFTKGVRVWWKIVPAITDC